MSLNLVDLDDTTRRHALAELERDVQAKALFISARLAPWGCSRWPALLREALTSHDDAWLAEQLRRHGWFHTVEPVSYGGLRKYWRRMPEDAPQRLAESEFNRFIMRGICARTIEAGRSFVIVYRARPTTPRAEVAAKIGKALDARALIETLRARGTLEEVLHTPDAFSAGLSVRMRRSA